MTAVSSPARATMAVRLAVRLAVAAALVIALPSPSPAGAQGGGVDVVVFEGRGVGHGVGMPLDGANQLAAEGSSADEILDRFYPETSKGRGSGLVRVLVGTRDDLAQGIDITFPDGGGVRDGRSVPVSAAFPIRVPAGGRARLTFGEGIYRTEVLDGHSVSGTHEVTETTAPPPPPDAETTPTFPGLGASERPLWLEATRSGSLTLARSPDGDERALRGPLEVVAEAERLHVVAELDVESYLMGVDVSLPDDAPLEPAALEAAVIAARTYAVRAAAAEPEVGRFHVWDDERSLPYPGPAEVSDAWKRAVADTRGEIVTFQGEPAAALISAGAGGETAGVRDVFGSEAPALPYLAGGRYAGADEFRWRTDIALSDAANRLGYEGDAQSLSVASMTDSGRPAVLRISGSAGDLDVPAPTFLPALRLPSTMFEVHTEERVEAPPARQDAAPFQELPGEPLAAIGTAGPEVLSGGGRSVPVLAALLAAALLGAALLVLGLANVQRRLRARLARRAARTHHPTAVEPQPEPHTPTTGRVTQAQSSATRPGAPEGPTWHNEPEWLYEVLSDAPSTDRITPEPTVTGAPLTEPPAAEPTANLGDDAHDDEPPPTRSLREVLGWNDAPEWLDDIESGADPDDHP